MAQKKKKLFFIKFFAFTLFIWLLNYTYEYSTLNVSINNKNRKNNLLNESISRLLLGPEVEQSFPTRPIKTCTRVNNDLKNGENNDTHRPNGLKKNNKDQNGLKKGENNNPQRPNGLKKDNIDQNGLKKGENNIPQRPNGLKKDNIDQNGLKKGENNIPQRPNGLKKGENNIPQHPNGLKKGENNIPQHPNGLKKGENNIPQRPNGLKKGEDNIPQHPNGLKKGENNIPQRPNGLKKGEDNIPQRPNGLKKGENNNPQRPNGLKKDNIDQNGLKTGENNIPQHPNGLKKGENNNPQRPNGLKNDNKDQESSKLTQNEESEELDNPTESSELCEISDDAQVKVKRKFSLSDLSNIDDMDEFLAQLDMNDFSIKKLIINMIKKKDQKYEEDLMKLIRPWYFKHYYDGKKRTIKSRIALFFKYFSFVSSIISLTISWGLQYWGVVGQSSPSSFIALAIAVAMLVYLIYKLIICIKRVKAQAKRNPHLTYRDFEPPNKKKKKKRGFLCFGKKKKSDDDDDEEYKVIEDKDENSDIKDDKMEILEKKKI
ncbi:hypothetical protein MKS88_004053 [Plasmodium brasilianum]|uniref:Uncharacterized protein n=1 Tax=Plasmodium brasilianum TaxID=5824 RepID=A0ACB9Y4L9_PLABR|nr:hypothetical protein MKS88_004053 [Plasmodium brasilianum]